MNRVSIVSTTAARVIIAGFVAAVCFHETVVPHTRRVLQKAKEGSPGLAIFTICISTLALLRASDEVACKVLGLAETCPPTSEEHSLVTAVEDPRSPDFSHDDSNDFKTPLSSPSVSPPSPKNSSDSIVTLATASTVSKLGNVFRDMTPSPPAGNTDDNDADLAIRQWALQTVPEFGTPIAYAHAPESVLNSVIKRMKSLSLLDRRSFPSTPTRA
ncbi:uncharacterized protein EDB91DRAFT_111044 [Suillus paluster]|uniref:uncharacterized protein n=1 Tax=Suillus paluster TaxID=48578 RepID=UPI001B877D75|nr:uncharacterized protein EDB91DRAFT_111044 [Suillus paluster]KAG1746728.1 hypothetical protein EDB91DRAFT_111044 [Suillus paluster]